MRVIGRCCGEVGHCVGGAEERIGDERGEGGAAGEEEV